MQKLASEFKNTSVVSKKEKAILGVLEDIILNPETGAASGISFKVPGKKDLLLVANASEITGAGTNFIMIETAEKVGAPDEIIRIKEVLDKDISLIESKVIDEDERYMGKIRDYSINLKTMRLERLYVATSGFLKIIPGDLMIPESDIVKIEKNRVIVRGGRVKGGKKVSNYAKGV